MEALRINIKQLFRARSIGYVVVIVSVAIFLTVNALLYTKLFMVNGDGSENSVTSSGATSEQTLESVLELKATRAGLQDASVGTSKFSE